MNLPNALTVARIAVAPLIALLPFSQSWGWRFAAFALFIAAAVSDYYDGKLARTRNMETDLGRLLDPLADKLLLVGTLIPMFVFMVPADDPAAPLVRGVEGAHAFPFDTPFGAVGLPWWVVAIVLGRELAMTVFRQVAARRGVIIAAIGPAKVKTGFQSTWVGAAYFWFGALTLAREQGWGAEHVAWRAWVFFNCMVGVITMVVAVLLTLYSLWLYLRRYGAVVFGPPPAGARSAPRD